jgi:hypothetical protein
MFRMQVRGAGVENRDEFITATRHMLMEAAAVSGGASDLEVEIPLSDHQRKEHSRVEGATCVMSLDPELPQLLASILPRFLYSFDTIWQTVPEEALANILHSLVHHTYHNPEVQECLGSCRGLPEGLCCIMQCRHDPSQGFAALCMSQIALAGQTCPESHIAYCIPNQPLYSHP